jgi:hypothetical protein
VEGGSEQHFMTPFRPDLRERRANSPRLDLVRRRGSRASFFCGGAPGTPRSPKVAQKTPNGTPREPKAIPRDPRVPQRIPRASQGGPRGSQRSPRAPQGSAEAPQREPNGGKGSPSNSKYMRKLPINRPSGRYVKLMAAILSIRCCGPLS